MFHYNYTDVLLQNTTSSFLFLSRILFLFPKRYSFGRFRRWSTTADVHTCLQILSFSLSPFSLYLFLSLSLKLASAHTHIYTHAHGIVRFIKPIMSWMLNKLHILTTTHPLSPSSWLRTCNAPRTHTYTLSLSYNIYIYKI